MSRNHCKYCNSPTSIKCQECNTFFCNNYGKMTISHILFHFNRKKHRSASINDNVFCCIQCSSTNVFDLGYNITDTSIINVAMFQEFLSAFFNEFIDKDYMEISLKAKNFIQEFMNGQTITHINGTIFKQLHDILTSILDYPTDNNQNIADLVDEVIYRVKDAILKLMMNKLTCRVCMDTNDFRPIISERAFISIFQLENLNLQADFIKIEGNKDDKFKVKLPKIKENYTTEEYLERCVASVEVEAEAERKRKGNWRVTDVKLRFEECETLANNADDDESYGSDDGTVNYAFCFLNMNDHNKVLNEGDELVIINEQVKISVFVDKIIRYPHEAKLCIKDYQGYIDTEALYKVEYKYFNVGTKRQMNALINFSNIHETVREYLVRGDENGRLSMEENEATTAGWNINDEENVKNDKMNKRLQGNNSLPEKEVQNKARLAYSISQLSINTPNYIKMPFGTASLNESQLEAVKAALIEPICLIQGPPGTGKTTTSATIVYNLYMQKKHKIIVSAMSNVAINHLSEKISKTEVNVVRIVSIKRQRLPDNLTEISLHYLVKMAVKRDHNFNIDNKSKTKTGIARRKHLRELYSRRILENANVITCTLCSAGQPLLKDIEFPVVLIDEAAQCTETMTLIPITKGCKKLILVGDQKQLPPMVVSKAIESAGYAISMFERLINRGAVPYLLKYQYRMHPLLCQWPSTQFYNDELISGVTEEMRKTKIRLPLPTFFYSSLGLEELGPSGTSYINQTDAEKVFQIVEFLISSGIRETQIGVITFYDSQREYLVDKYLRHISNFEDIEVNNVDAFQGREKDYIILSFVRSNSIQGIGFVADARRLNVAITRAKYGCILIGNIKTLEQNELMSSLIQFYEERNLLLEGPLSNLNEVKRYKNKTGDLCDSLKNPNLVNVNSLTQ